MSDQKKTFLSWERYTELVLGSWARLPDKQHVKAIAGIPRGGFVAAVMLSHHTGLPLVMLEEAATKLTRPIDSDFHKLLLVDDIIDSGETIKAAIRKVWPCLHAVAAPIARHRFAHGIDVEIYPDDPITGLKGFEQRIPVYAGWHYLDDAPTWWVFPYEQAKAPTERDGTYV